MSVCKFPDEFSCNSGACVDIFKHCDNMKECDDGSDKDGCNMLSVPDSYNVKLPPEKENEVTKPMLILSIL